MPCRAYQAVAARSRDELKTTDAGTLPANILSLFPVGSATHNRNLDLTCEVTSRCRYAHGATIFQS
ncbi:hypothetical protein DOTSEDRAFT_40997 [Dothistroma septosporum NZE10]|uniref:Uncharacterized protein n=1 Tax=Dothistroma septosporum (strain NZE10 / CBS 128990) TaxID=675120 RepID=N1Q2B2_DOTSN|nr:hypothetical protein DOTSEDRAFT_40997 [Dothistroma septosporum NZE10]